MSMGIAGLWDRNRRTVRAPVNPLDKSTIVSIYPQQIYDHKCTLQPGSFLIPAGSFEKPSVLTIGPSSWWREIDPDQPLLEIPVASIVVADSFVKDWCVGMLACNMADAMPGLFYVPGEHNSESIKKNHFALLAKAAQSQKNWYAALVKMADVLWSRTNGNPLAVSDLMRMAARELGHEDKEWLKDYQHVSMVKCHACGSLRNPQFPVCGNCRAIDPSYKGEIKFA